MTVLTEQVWISLNGNSFSDVSLDKTSEKQFACPAVLSVLSSLIWWHTKVVIQTFRYKGTDLYHI